MVEKLKRWILDDDGFERDVEILNRYIEVVCWIVMGFAVFYFGYGFGQALLREVKYGM